MIKHEQPRTKLNQNHKCETEKMKQNNTADKA